ncbi:MAG: cation-translocating P-type ATPase [Spirochaetota bacterium]
MIKMSKKQIIIVSGILTALSFALKQTLGYAPLAIAAMLATTVVAGTPIFRKAFGALRYRIVGIDALVTIAVSGALLIGEYWEAAAVTFLFMFGDYLEARTIEKTRSSIRSLLDLAPDRARVRRNGVDLEVKPEEVMRGDLVVLKPGERIPVDGKVVEGSSYVNQATITGESIPVHKYQDEAVFSGTMIESGYLVVVADRVGDDTTFARILHLVEEAQDKKAKTQKFLEKFSRWYTPAVVVLASVTYLITRDIRLSLTLLVIACPGALVISAPVSIVAGIGNGAKHGVLVKGGDIMEKLGTVKVVAFDKTGTLTIGKPTVTSVHAFSVSEEELLTLAAIGESYSEHPLARAIVRKASELLGPVNAKPEHTRLITGQGLEFTYQGEDYLIGNRAMFAGQGMDQTMSRGDLAAHETQLTEAESKGQTAVLLGTRTRILGIMAIADVLRKESKELVSALKAQGIRKVVMLTGDNKLAAKAIADELGLDGYFAELLPEGKVQALKELQQKYGRVAMVGDGVNDAPALASADLGIAIGGAGSDVAMETADVVLLSDDVRRLSYAVGLSRATVINMKQNIGFALVVAATLLAGVLGKTVNLSIGMFIHELSVLLVIINAVRLLGYSQRRSIFIAR